MKKLIFLLTVLFFQLNAHSQTYAYSFSGNLSNESTENLSKELKALKSFLSVEIRTKTEASKGEIIFSVDPMNDRGENDHPFSPVDVKAILLRNGLQPIDFRQIK